MAVSYLGSSESHTGTSGSVSQTTFSWTHTAGGTPYGVAVLCYSCGPSGNTNPVTSVTYGGTALTAVSGASATCNVSGGEPGNVTAYYLGVSVPTSSTATVTVNRTSNTTIVYAACITVGSDKAWNTEPTGVVLLQGDSTASFSAQAVDDGSVSGESSLRVAGAYYGGNSPAPVDSANTTLAVSIDLGSYGCSAGYETTAGTGSRSVGFSSGTDDRAGVHFAIREMARRPGVGALAFTGLAPTLLISTTIAVATGALAFTGLAPPVNQTIRPPTGVVELTGAAPTLSQGVIISPSTGSLQLTGAEPALKAVVAPATGTLQLTGAAPKRLSLSVELREGDTVRAARPISLTDSFATSEWELTTEEAAAITDWSALRIALISDGAQVAVSWVELDAPATTILRTPTTGALQFTGAAPTQTLAIAPSPGALSFTGLAPDAQVSSPAPGIRSFFAFFMGGGGTGASAPPIEIVPGVGALQISGAAPRLLASLVPTTGALQLTGQAPDAQVTNNWTRPRSATASAGTFETYDISRAWDDDGTTLVGIESTGTAPGFAFDFTFTAVPENEARSLVIRGNYSGSPAHDVKLQQWNFNSSSWVDLTSDTADLPNAASETLYTHPLLGSTGNFWSSGEIRIRISHAAVGTPTHRLYLDQIALSTGIVAHPGTGALQATGQAPLLRATTRPPTGALQATGAAPLLRAVARPTVGALQLAGLAPTARVTQLITPSTGSLQLGGQAPLLTQRLVPGTGSLLTSGSAPLLKERLVPATGALQLTGYAPAAASGLRIVPSTGTLALTGASPALQSRIVPDTGLLQLLGAAPTQRWALQITPPTGTLQLLGLEPQRLSGINAGTRLLAFWAGGAGATPMTESVTCTTATGTLQITGLPPYALGAVLARGRWGDLSSHRGWHQWGPYPEGATVSTPPALVPLNIAPDPGALVFTGLFPLVQITARPGTSGPIHWMRELGDYSDTRRWGPFSGGGDRIPIPPPGALQFTGLPPIADIQYVNPTIAPTPGALVFGGLSPVLRTAIGPRRLHVSWAQLETPFPSRRLFLSWAQMEMPSRRRIQVSWAQLEVPDEPRAIDVSWAEMEIPDPEPTGRRLLVSWARLRLPSSARLDRLTEPHTMSSTATAALEQPPSPRAPVTARLSEAPLTGGAVSDTLTTEPTTAPDDSDPDIL